MARLRPEKSFLVQDMALSIARGLPVCGREARRAAIYCAFEGGRGFRKRQLAYARYHGLEADADVPMVVLTKRADLFGDEDFDPVMRRNREMARGLSYPLGLTVLDTGAPQPWGERKRLGRRVQDPRQGAQDRRAVRVRRDRRPPQAGGRRQASRPYLTGDFESTVDVDWAEGYADTHGRRGAGRGNH